MNQVLSWPLLTVSLFYFRFEFAIEFVTHTFQFCCCFLISNGTSHLAQGKKKDATYIASLFEPWISKLDPAGVFIDCVFFMAQAMSKRLVDCLRRSTLASMSRLVLWQVRLMLVNYRRLYHLFGSGSMQRP
jgi:hypothetical protein